jgi:GT2 family glycosyltransferase
VVRRKKRAAAKQQLRIASQSNALLVARAHAELERFMASNDRLTAPANDRAPDVSIIITIWNQPHFLLRCLRAAVAQTGASVEFVLVDNASANQTLDLLSRLDGFRIIRNSINAGYVRGCNQGARLANGRCLLFLNSDTFVRAGALAAGVAALDNDSQIGAVGGCLVHPSGLLQEAGCFVRADGTTGGHAAGSPLNHRQAMIPRDVDYCSGAFLMTPASVWRSLGGFDEIYSPGYYEESDYCLRLASKGLRVLFEPKIIADHYQFGSQARPGDALRVSERNRQIFTSRHADILRTRLPRSA